MALVAGVDSSTQSVKVVVRDRVTGATVRTGRAPHPAGTEVHPDAWWDALLAAFADAGGLDDVAAISIAGQQHGMVVLDTDGAVVRPALLWNDTRSAAAADALVAEFGAAALAERTGLVPVASFTSTKLRWLRDAEPEAAARVAAVALPHDWLTWRLLGGGPGTGRLDDLTTDRSDASGTGYLGRDGAWDRELLVSSLGHDAALPRVLGPGEAAGRTDGSVDGVPAGIVVGPGAGDNAGAALGLGSRPGDVVVSIGTSGTVFAVAEEPIADPTGTIAGFADAAGGYLPLVATLNAARVLDATAQLLGVDHTELASLAAAAPPGAGGLVLTPYLEGERTPNLPGARGSLTGLSLETMTPGHLARAAVEGVLCGLADGLDAIRAQGVQVDRVLLIGGAAANAAVAGIAAQVFDADVVVPAPDEYVAAGAAVQAAWALTGERPAWPVPADVRVDADPRPAIRDAYAAARSRLHPELG